MKIITYDSSSPVLTYDSGLIYGQLLPEKVKLMARAKAGMHLLTVAGLMQFLQKELQFAELKNKVTNKTRAEIDKQQREYFLQQQLKSIKEELGGDPNEREIKGLQKKAEALTCDEDEVGV